LLVATDTDELVTGFLRHESEPMAADMTRNALTFLADEHDRSDVYQLIRRGTREDPTALAQFEALVEDLLAAVSAS
jgi:hypothetical protein